MEMFILPGFSELFENKQISYDKLLEDIPADITIQLLSSLNNELNTPESEDEKQKRLIRAVSYRFSPKQNAILDEAFYKYKYRNNAYRGHVFARRYILAMLMKEVAINRTGIQIHDTPNHEFNFLLAYFHIIDGVNQKDNNNWGDFSQKNFTDPLWQYKLLWTPNINQLEFNQSDNGPIGIVKLLSLCKYALHNFRLPLKEYLSINKFNNISQFVESFRQIAVSTLNYKPHGLMRKDNLVRPRQMVDTTHLKSLCINSLLGTPITTADIRKFPLFETESGDFRVIDEGMYYRKLYKGPFFDLYHKTKLKDKMTFNEYSTTISKDVLESTCFNGICKSLRKTKYQKLHFDNNSLGMPDCYFRNNKKILFIEFKDYNFPDALIAKPDFEKIKKYIDERLVKSDNGKPKGVTQLFNYIKLLRDGKYDFDDQLNKHLNQNKTIDLYPVICYTDFMFTLPGLTQYLNELFQKRLSQDNFLSIRIKPVTLISIDTLFYYSYRSGNFDSLLRLIDRYWKLINERQRKLKKVFSTKNFLQSTSSFDEIYDSIFMQELKKGEINKRNINKIANVIGITQHELDQTL